MQWSSYGCKVFHTFPVIGAKTKKSPHLLRCFWSGPVLNSFNLIRICTNSFFWDHMPQKLNIRLGKKMNLESLNFNLADNNRSNVCFILSKLSWKLAPGTITSSMYNWHSSHWRPLKTFCIKRWKVLGEEQSPKRHWHELIKAKTSGKDCLFSVHRI